MPAPSLNPYTNANLNHIYNLLFCDNLELFKKEEQNTVYPWNILFSESYDKEDLKKIIEDKNIESRIKILAYRKLLKHRDLIEKKEILGVIIEVGLEEGLDVLAAYKDGTARYINHSEKIIIWENPTETSQTIIDTLFAHSKNVVEKIGPWDKERLLYPTAGMVRLTFLVSDGLYFGQGPLNILSHDSMGGPVIKSGIELMKLLTETALRE